MKKRGNGQGTAFRRGNSWTAQTTLYMYVEDGKLKRKYKTKGGFATKREALGYIDELRRGGEREVPTLLSLYRTWEATEFPKLSYSKQSAYRKARERIEPIIYRRIDTLTTADLQEVVSTQAHSYYTARDIKTLLSHLYSRACADMFVPTNLTQFIVLPELVEAEPQPFTPDEVEKLWSAYADGDIFIGYLLLMIYSGLMPAELLACRKDMIDLERCEIYGCGKKTKNRKETAVVFADIVRPVVEELCSLYDGEKLYPKHKTEFYRDYHEAVGRVVGVRDLPPYSCRHTTGTEAAKLNLSAPIIQKIMRHSKISTSQRYIHLGAEDAHAGLNQFPMTNA